LTERLQIVRMGHRGDGVAETEVGLLYVPQALPGETVDIRIAAASLPEARRPALN
jgi:23S rRNA (uracil1939-C5)-methyltransferase